MNLSQIKQDALKATAGPWGFHRKEDGSYYLAGSNEFGAHILPYMGRLFNFPRNIEANARHIANMDPPTTIALVEEVERLRAVRAEADDALRACMNEIWWMATQKGFDWKDEEWVKTSSVARAYTKAAEARQALGGSDEG